MDTVVDSIVEQLTGKLNECIQSLQGLKEIIGIMKQSDKYCSMERLPISQCTNQLPTGSQLTLPSISHKITGIKCTLNGTELVHLSGPETPMCEPVKCSSDVEHNCERYIVSGDETDEDHLDNKADKNEQSLLQNRFQRTDQEELSELRFQRNKNVTSSLPVRKKRSRAPQKISHPQESDSDQEQCHHSQEVTLLSEVDVSANTDAPQNDMEISLNHGKSTDTVCEGYLHKEGSRITSRRRYLVLTKEYLYYFKSEKDFKPRGIIPLIDLKLERMNKYTFELRCKQTALPNKVKKQNDYYYRAIRLKASSEAEMITWINNIGDAITALKS